ncbi:MAG: Smr/MutS family protein [Gammaproteobacteria bacterium]|nr:Smr/MutS family protein [Gammaproteobacteria bacterium]
MTGDKKTELDAEERALFRDSVGPVQPVISNRVIPERPKPKPQPLPQPLQVDDDIDDVLSDAFDPVAGNDFVFMRPGIQRNRLRKLAQGQLPILAELDLHGLTIPQARRVILGFIDECQRRRITCALLIHGKGTLSQDKPVLKHKVNIWLRQLPAVLAFTPAQPRHGGGGALYILLRLPG